MRPAERILRSDEFRQLADRQDGVVSIRQLLDLGLDRRVIWRRDGNQWQVIGRHVVSLSTGSLTRRQGWWAGVLHAGPGSALAGLTALEAAGFRSFDSEIVHGLTRHGTGRRQLDCPAVRIKVHERLALAQDVSPVGEPRRTRTSPSVIDAAGWAVSDGQARAIIAASVQQRLARCIDLRSSAKLRWLRGLRRFGLPEPSRQQIVRRSSGRYYLDGRFDPWNVAVEINGAQHLELLHGESDAERRFALSAGGLLVIDISSYLVRRHIGVAMLRTARGLYSRGWRPQARSVQRLGAVAAERGEQLWLPDAA